MAKEPKEPEGGAATEAPAEAEAGAAEAEAKPASAVSKRGMLIVILVSFVTMVSTPLTVFLVLKLTRPAEATVEKTEPGAKKAAEKTEKSGGHGGGGEKKASGGHGAKKASGGHGGGHGAKKEEEATTAEDAEAVYDVDPITTDIYGTQGTRYLRVAVHIVCTEPGLMDELTKRKAMVKDRILSILATKPLAELEGGKARDLIKKQITETIDAEYSEKMVGVVKEIYYSEFLVQ